MRGACAALGLTLTQIAPAYRSQAPKAARAAPKAAEARRILALLSPRDCVVPLDEHGAEPTHARAGAVARTATRSGGQDLAFIIGGPDGLGEEVLARAHCAGRCRA